MYRINDPFLYFEDLNGVPLNNGYIYFGVAGANPETSPITVYYDEAGTQPAAQPIRTINGYPVRNGSAAQLFINTECSLTVKDSNLVLVTYLANANLFDTLLKYICYLYFIS